MRQVLKKLSAFQNKIIDGHAPLLSGKDLCAYLTAGIRSDHECTRLSEAREKLALGMVVMIREDTQAKNLKDLLPLVTPDNARRCLLVTDDRPPEQLAKEGHLNAVLKQAVGLGLDPIRAIQLVTLNTAEYFGLRHLGAVAPGYQADIVVLNSLSDMTVDSVFKKGKLVAEKGRFLGKVIPAHGSQKPFRNEYQKPSCRKISNSNGGSWAKVIELVPDQILTRAVRYKVQGKDGWLSLNPKEDLVILACVERHKGTGNVGLGTGFRIWFGSRRHRLFRGP